MFMFIWKIVKVIIAKTTKDRIEFHSSDKIKHLENYIENEKIPYFFKGNCQYKLEEQPGPWQECFKNKEIMNNRFSKKVKGFLYIYNSEEIQSIFKNIS